MKVNIEIELQPFTVPNYVLVVEKPSKREDGFKEGRKFHLSEIDAITLLKLCNDFRNEVFRKAGKDQPPEATK